MFCNKRWRLGAHRFRERWLAAPTIRLLMLAAAGLAASAAGADPVSFERYQVIIDRAPFGGLPGAADPTTPQPNFAERFMFVGIVEEDGRLLAVIQPQGSPRAEYKAEGETIGDVTVLKIEPGGESSKLTLQQGLAKATLTYPARSAASNPPAPAPAAVQPAAAAGAKPTVVAPPRRRIPFRRGQ